MRYLVLITLLTLAPLGAEKTAKTGRSGNCIQLVNYTQTDNTLTIEFINTCSYTMNLKFCALYQSGRKVTKDISGIPRLGRFSHQLQVDPTDKVKRVTWNAIEWPRKPSTPDMCR